MHISRLIVITAISLSPQFVSAADPTPETIERFLNAYQFEPIRETWASKMERDAKTEIAKLRTTPGLNGPMRAAIDKYEVEALAELHTELAADNLRPKYAAIFGKVYTEEEMMGITRFYESDIGKTSVRKRPQIAALIQAQFSVLASELSRNLVGARSELEKSLRDPQKK